MKSYRWIINGKVQGVGYRNSCAKKAKDLDLKGTVKNLSTGEVQVDVEGPQELIEKFKAWCKRGPLFAVVDNIEETELEARGFREFLIVR